MTILHLGRALSCLAISFVANPACSKDNIFSSRVDYINHVITDKLFDGFPTSVSLSFENIQIPLDRSAVTSFVDAFLWTTDVRTTLRINADADVIFVYLDNFEYDKARRFNNDLIAQLYHNNFDVIKNGGSFARFYIRSAASGFEKSIVFINAASSFDSRMTAIYRFFRARFGLSEYYKMDKFGDTLLMDLRILRCRLEYQARVDLVAAMSNGNC